MMRRGPRTSWALIAAGAAYGMDGGHFQVAVLGIVVLDSGIRSGVLGIFLHVVKLLMGNDAGGGDGLADVLRKGDAAVTAV